MEFGGGKVAIITGGSRGIGAGLVEAFSKHGYRVIANSRTITDSPHPEVASVAGDIADPTTSERLVSEAVARFGRIDTLINKARVFRPKPFVFYTADDCELVTSLNVLGHFRITQRVIAEMLAQDSGHQTIGHWPALGSGE